MPRIYVFFSGLLKQIVLCCHQSNNKLAEGAMRYLLKKVCVIALAGASVSACSSQATVYHWQSRNDVGPNRFVVDHNYCMREADTWPFETSFHDIVDYISPGPHDPKHRIDPREDRVWASFIPYPGAQAIYVNDVNSSNMIDGGEYVSCMESRGYVQAYPEEHREHLINDRRMGYRGDYF